MAELIKISLDLLDDPKLAIRTELDDEGLQELMASMSDVGLLEPIIVRKVANRFEVIAGARRTRAARLLNWTHIEGKVVKANEEEVLALRLTENLQRKDLDPVDEACFIGEIMLKYKKDAPAMATLLKRSEKWITERIEVCKMPDYIQDHLKQKKYPLGAALWIARIKNENTMRYYANWAAVNGVTVAYAHRWYVTTSESPNVFTKPEDIQVENPDGSVAQRKIIKCGRCGQDLFLDEANSVFIHPTCPEKTTQEKE